MSRPISRAEMKDEVNEIWKECQKEGGRMTDFERGYRQGQADYFRWVKTFSGGKPNYIIPPETPAAPPQRDGSEHYRDMYLKVRDELAELQQRPWVGLTDEEIKSLPSWWPSYEDAPALIELVKDVEAKLKEKNDG